MRLADAFSDSTPTMLGIGLMSAATVRAGLRAAAETGTSAVFIASRNQVESAELGGGYAEGWDQAGLIRFPWQPRRHALLLAADPRPGVQQHPVETGGRDRLGDGGLRQHPGARRRPLAHPRRRG